MFLVADPDDPEKLVERPYATTVILYYGDKLTTKVSSTDSTSATEDNN